MKLLLFEQFKENSYMRPYFNTEMKISKYDWETSFLIPELKKKADECAFASGKPEYMHAYRGNMKKLNFHISQLSNEAGKNADQVLDLLRSDDFSRDNAYVVTVFLDTLQKVCRKEFLYYSEKKDAITDSLVKAIGQGRTD